MPSQDSSCRRPWAAIRTCRPRTAARGMVFPLICRAISLCFTRLREFVWVSGCVTALAAWVSGPSALASRGHGVADVVGPVAPPGRASGRGGCKRVYTDRRKWSLGAVLGHLCTLLRRELRRVARAPQLPWCAGSAPSVLCLSPSRENRFCASGAAARLAFSLRCQPTQTPEEPVLPTDFALFY